jgi:hypothetical protein
MSRLKKLLSPEDFREGYRPKFEAKKRAENPATNLATTGGVYVDAAVQKEWLDWAELEYRQDVAW